MKYKIVLNNAVSGMAQFMIWTAPMPRERMVNHTPQNGLRPFCVNRENLCSYAIRVKWVPYPFPPNSITAKTQYLSAESRIRAE